MKITWEVDDGYVGAARHHTTVIDDADLADYEEGVEREDFIENCVRDDFEREISWREIRRES